MSTAIPHKLIWLEERGQYIARARVAGRWRERATGTRIRREAERALARWLVELETGSATKRAGPATWRDLAERFTLELSPTMERRTATSYETAFRSFERLARPGLLAEITTATLLDFRAKLLGQGRSPATAANYLRHVRAALHEARDAGLVASVPVMPRAKRGTTGAKMKGFALSRAEFRRWLRSEPDDRLRSLLILLWLSGLRLGEALSLHRAGAVDERRHNVLDLAAAPFPMLRFARQKSGKRQSWPMPPDLARWLSRLFRRPATLWAWSRLGSLDHVSRRVSESGARSGVARHGQTPTAHDLRRSFGTRWSRRLLPQHLMRLMRHASIATTMVFYVDLAADDLAEIMRGLGTARRASRNRDADAKAKAGKESAKESAK